MSYHRLMPAFCGALALLAAAPGQSQTAASPKPATAQAAQGAEIEEVVVTGIRQSLEAAQDIKRNAATVVEAITSEDLGKFSDSSVSDALTRVPGVQVTKNDDGDGGDAIAVRGLGSGFTVSTLNGRSLLTSGGGAGAGIRGFNLDQIPTEILSGVMLYKSPSAETIENGLAGLIEYQTLRPLDYKVKSGRDFYVGGTLRSDYDSNNEKYSPRVSAVALGKSGDGRFGGYVSIIVSDEKKRDDSWTAVPFIADIQQQATVGGPITTTENVAAYNETNFQDVDIKTKRRTGSAGLQFRPNDSLDINLDLLYNSYDRVPRSRLGRSVFGPNYYSIYDGVFSPGGITIQNNRVVQVDSSLQTGGGYPVFLIADQESPNSLKTYSVGGNVAWHNDNWKVALDFAHSNVDFERRYSTFYAYAGAYGGLTGSYDTRGSSIPVVNISSGYLDPAQYTNAIGTDPAPDYFGQNQFSKKNRDEFKVDIQRELSDAFLLKFGARLERTKEDYRTSQLEVASYQPVGFQLPPSSLPQLADAFLTGQVLSTTYGFKYPGTNFYAGCAIVPDVCAANNFGKLSFAGGLPEDPLQYRASYFGEPGKDAQPFQTSGAHIFHEQTMAFYTQFDAKGNLMGIDSSGNIGLRAVRIKEEGLAYQGQTRYNNPIVATATPLGQHIIAAEHEYWEYLPSANIRMSPRENLNLRGSVARVISLPDIGALSPESNISFYDPNDPFYSVQNHGFGSSGNIALKPTSSWNFDLTGEYYTANRGAVVVSLFYKKISDFVLGQQTSGVTLPGFAPGTLFDLSQPVNFSSAYAKGFEIGGNQPFTFLPSPFDGFGVQANYTYVDSALDKQAGGKIYGIPGSSENNLNAVAYYEKYGFGARIAMNYRSDYFLYLGSPAFGGNFVRYVKGATYVDASLTYAFNPHFSVQLSGTNLTKTNAVQYNEDKNFPLAIFERPATYSLGVSASF